MPTKEFVDSEPDVWIEAASDVFEELSVYQGGVIVRGVSPLWLAVVKLEKLSIKTLPRERNILREGRSGEIPASNGGRRLHYPSGPWFRLVWTSRRNEVKAARAWGDLFQVIIKMQMKYIRAGVLPRDLSKNAEYRKEVKNVWNPAQSID